MIMKLLDVQLSGTTFAILRVPTNLRYGTGENTVWLVLNGRAVNTFLVGRFSQLFLEMTKLAANINTVPLLPKDLDIASGLISHDSQPAEDPKDYPSNRASVNKVREPGTNTGLKRKQEEGARLDEDLSVGDLVALKLHIKKYSGQNEKAKHASFKLVAVQILRCGTADNVKDVQASVAPAKTDAFGDDCFLPIKLHMETRRDDIAVFLGLGSL